MPENALGDAFAEVPELMRMVITQIPNRVTNYAFPITGFGAVGQSLGSVAREAADEILVMVTVLEFDDTDYHNLIDLLVEAVKVTEATGERPSVVINGRTYAPYDLVKVAALLPHNEPLTERHAALVATVFDRRQRGYGRTAYNLAHRANQFASDMASWAWMYGGATPKGAELIPTPEELATLIKEEIEMGDIVREEARAPYYRRIGEIMLRAKSQMEEDDFKAWCEKVTGKSWAQCSRYMRSASKRRRP
jgi:hypothetical protein